MRRSRALLFNRPTEKLELLLTPLNRLPITIEDSFFGEALRVVRADLKRARIKYLEPQYYLSTGYGTVAGTTTIALGFYDCNDVLQEINHELRGFRYTRDEIINIIRHEVGHAFAYGYKLYRRKDFRQVFKVKGNYFNTYPLTDRYVERANPWSRDFVNPGGDYYAQKHPDDDFAETFMVWLMPRYNWRRAYRRYPGALRKLEFVDKLVSEVRRTEPLIDQSPNLYEPLDDFRETLARFYRLRTTRAYRKRATGYIDPDLIDMFWRPAPTRGKRKREQDYVHADNFIRKHKRDIAAQVSRWSEVDPRVVQDFLDKCRARAHALDLWVRKETREKKVIEFTSYVSYRCGLYASNERYLE